MAGKPSYKQCSGTFQMSLRGIVAAAAAAARGSGEASQSGRKGTRFLPIALKQDVCHVCGKLTILNALKALFMQSARPLELVHWLALRR